MNDKPSAAAVEMAAQVWCTEATMRTPMDVVLANEFALIIDRLREENAALREQMATMLTDQVFLPSQREAQLILGQNVKLREENERLRKELRRIIAANCGGNTGTDDDCCCCAIDTEIARAALDATAEQKE